MSSTSNSFSSGSRWAGTKTTKHFDHYPRPGEIDPYVKSDGFCFSIIRDYRLYRWLPEHIRVVEYQLESISIFHISRLNWSTFQDHLQIKSALYETQGQSSAQLKPIVVFTFSQWRRLTASRCLKIVSATCQSCLKMVTLTMSWNSWCASEACSTFDFLLLLLIWRSLHSEEEMRGVSILSSNTSSSRRGLNLITFLLTLSMVLADTSTSIML